MAHRHTHTPNGTQHGTWHIFWVQRGVEGGAVFWHTDTHTRTLAHENAHGRKKIFLSVFAWCLHRSAWVQGGEHWSQHISTHGHAHTPTSTRKRTRFFFGFYSGSPGCRGAHRWLHTSDTPARTHIKLHKWRSRLAILVDMLLHALRD